MVEIMYFGLFGFLGLMLVIFILLKIFNPEKADELFEPDPSLMEEMEDDDILRLDGVYPSLFDDDDWFVPEKEQLLEMAKLKDIELIADYLQKIKNIKGIEDIQIINIPDDVEADIGIRIKLKKGYRWQEILDKLNDIAWDLFEKKGELLAVYKEFEDEE